MADDKRSLVKYDEDVYDGEPKKSKVNLESIGLLSKKY